MSRVGRFLIEPAEARAIIERRFQLRAMPLRTQALLNAHINQLGLADTGYDPAWLEQRAAARAAKESDATL